MSKNVIFLFFNIKNDMFSDIFAIKDGFRKIYLLIINCFMFYKLKRLNIFLSLHSPKISKAIMKLILYY